MINILSLRCALAFAPYLADSAEQFVNDNRVVSRVVKQGGNGLIIRSDGQLLLRHQNREAALSETDARHYRATIKFRADAYEIRRMQDEIVMSSFARDLILSFPQSELWLEADHVSQLVRAYEENNPPSSLPDWLNVSTAAGRLLISDQRNGRWALLGSDHVDELKRRIDMLNNATSQSARIAPPVIPLKGINVHLQSAFKLAEAFEQLADAGNVAEFDDVTANFSLAVRKSTEGIELRESEKRIAFTRREARKWADIIRAELERLNAAQAERGAVRTVFADADAGRWILQWGDEVFVSNNSLTRMRESQSLLQDSRMSGLRIREEDEFLLFLYEATGACVALTKAEAHFLFAVKTPLG